MAGASLYGAKLEGTKNNPINLRGADLSGIDLRSATLENCDLSGADLSGVNLSETKLINCNLTDVIVDAKTRLVDPGLKWADQDQFTKAEAAIGNRLSRMIGTAESRNCAMISRTAGASQIRLEKIAKATAWNSLFRNCHRINSAAMPPCLPPPLP